MAPNLVNTVVLACIAILAVLASAESKDKKRLIALALVAGAWGIVFLFWSQKADKHRARTGRANEIARELKPPADSLMERSDVDLKSLRAEVDGLQSLYGEAKRCSVYSDLAHLYWRRNDYGSAHDLYAHVAEILKASTDIGADDSLFLAAKNSLSEAILAHDRGLGTAEEDLQHAVALMVKLVPQHGEEARAETIRGRRFLILERRRHADKGALPGLVDQADSLLIQAADTSDCECLRQSPERLEGPTGSEVARLLMVKASILIDLESYSAAEVILRCTERLMSKLVDLGVEEPRFRYYCLSELGELLALQAEFPEARSLGLEAVRWLTIIDPGGYFQLSAVKSLARTYLAMRQSGALDSNIEDEATRFMYQVVRPIDSGLLEEWDGKMR